jgi:hybrid cluster-associated redox disulfide protein
MTATTRVRLGRASALTALPAPIVIGTRTFFLVRDGSTFRLLSNVCPHQGGAVHDAGDRFECALHGWRFDRTTGRCLNAPSRGLASVPVHVEAGGMLVADVPAAARVDRVHAAGATSVGLTVQLHAHACLEISYEGFTVLTDPWLDGPAFLGSWVQYPPPDVSGADLRPDAILITHEHSDHFHEPTLRLFDRSTPIYVPDFPNQRLQRRLAALGFTGVTCIRFGDPSVIHPGWRITTFEPQSYWNDAFLLLEVAGLRIFNVNDAGINARVAPMVAPIDVLAVQFSAGASGYPWTWAHLSNDEKIEISARACAGKLALIRESTHLYGASTVLPFASHFSLWHPSHREYSRLMKRNTLDDVKAALAGTSADVIDLIPGDRWDVGSGTICRADGDRAGLFAPDRIAAYTETALDAASFEVHHPAAEDLTEAELVDYLDRLNAIPEIVHCEDLTVRLRALPSVGNHDALDVSFKVAGAHLEVLDAPAARANLTITMPLRVLTAVIRDDLSWDEAFIGYWCRFDRYPNVYHAGFWRLLQAPYFKKPIAMTSPELQGTISGASTVAEVLEAHGSTADRILRRYGLYCSGCQHSTAESIEAAARQHGVDGHRVELLIRELARACDVSRSGDMQPVQSMERCR